MDKLKMHSPDITQQNIDKLLALFPNCKTEKQDDEGGLSTGIDFDLLKQELSKNIVEGPQERYQLNWPGKKEALLTANAPIAKTLRPCREESVDFETTKNLFIEGDNLDALKLLQETYLGKVKMIYIDPPYNTGKDFIYADNFSESAEEYFQESGQKDEEGNRLVANTDSNGRFHSDWLSMMYSRVKLSCNLLRDDGVLVVSIDDNEASNVIKLLNEVFGADNFVAQLAVQLNPRGRNLDKFIAKTHESVVVFVKDYMNDKSILGIEKEGRMIEEYNKTDSVGPFRLLGLRNRNQAFNPQTRPNLYYPLFISEIDGNISIKKTDTHNIEVLPDTPDGTPTCWTWGKQKVVSENHLLIAEKSGSEWRVYRKDYLHGAEGEIATTLVKSVWIDKDISNDYGRKEIKDLFGSSVMSFPKSVRLLERLVQIGSDKEGIVLDFFSGSATTAHAVMQLNASDQGNRKFLMVQLPEVCDEKSEAFKAGYTTIAEISKERIRRAGKKIKEENPEITNLDTGFRVLKIDSSNMNDVHYTPDTVSKGDLFNQVEHIKPDRSSEDLLFQVMLDWGVDLSLPIRKETIEGKEVYFVNDDDLVACFDKSIDEILIKALAAKAPLRVVFRDDCFVSDSVKINVEQIFKQLAPATDIKAI